MLRQFVNSVTITSLRPFSIAAWKYDPQQSKRDLRLDFLRGLFLVVMIIDHFRGAWISRLTYESLGTVSAAEGFVFISGMVAALVYLPLLETKGFRAMLRRVGRRVLHLYLAYVVFLGILLLLNYFAFPLKPFKRHAPPTSPLELVSEIATLHYAPFGFDIILLYILLLCFTPLILWLIHTHKTRWLLAGSLTLYVFNRSFPEMFMWQFSNKADSNFPVMVWQLLFVGGIVTFVNRKQLLQFWHRLSTLHPGVWVAVLFLLFFVLRQLWSSGAVVWNDASYDFWFDKTFLGVGRLLNFCVLALVIYWFVTHFWLPLSRVPAKLLIPLGQASLYVFMVHLIFTYTYRSFQASLPLETSGIYEVATILFIWLLVQRRFLFRFVPH